MSTSRRDLLKYFGAGSLIVPLAGAAPVGRLIETPRIELFEPPLIAKPIDLSKVRRVSVSLEMQDGTMETWNSAEVTGASGFAEMDNAVQVRFQRLGMSSPSYFRDSAMISAGPGARSGGRCPYCRSIVAGSTCQKCGASV